MSTSANSSSLLFQTQEGYLDDGRRAYTTNLADGSRTYYFYDDSGAYGTVPVGEYDADGVETALNVVGPDGWRERVVPDWTIYDGDGDYYLFGDNATDDFFAFDPQGSVAERLRVDDSEYSQPPQQGGGAFVPYLYDESAYNAWGERLLDYSPLGTSNSASGAQQIGQTDTAGYEAQFGYQTDTATGLLLAGHRFYQPQTRRWLNRDPTGYAGGTNLYEYSNDDPVNEADPSGDDPGSPYAAANFDPWKYFTDLFSHMTGRDAVNIVRHDPVVKAVGTTLNYGSMVPDNPVSDAMDLGRLGDAGADAARAWETAEAAGASRSFAGEARGAGDSAGTNIALGVGEHLESFAIKVNGKTYKQWGGSNWRSGFQRVMSNPNNTIHFNLDGPHGPINPWSAAQEGASRGLRGRATSWELNEIRSNPEWWSRIKFYQNGQEVPNPFR